MVRFEPVGTAAEALVAAALSRHTPSDYFNTYARGELVYLAGSVPSDVVFISNGSVSLLDPISKEEICRISGGDTVGLSCALSKQALQFTAAAATLVDAFRLPLDFIDSAIARDPAIVLTVSRLLSAEADTALAALRCLKARQSTRRRAMPAS